MPVDLALVRHGESESNLAKSRFEANEACANEKTLMSVHTSERRLTPRGVRQAQAAGAWLKEHLISAPESWPLKLYVSPYVRALETAGHFGFGNDWQPDVRLMERNWGRIDQMTYAERLDMFKDQLEMRREHAFFWRPDNGETLQDVFMRLRDMTSTLRAKYGSHRVIAVTHGETMWAWRTILEKLMPQDLRLKMLEHDEKTRIRNCRIIHYTRQDENGILSSSFERVRFVNPEDPDDPETNSGWMKIERRNWSHEDLLRYAGGFTPFIRESEDA
jgi:NAD+ kinase